MPVLASQLQHGDPAVVEDPGAAGAAAFGNRRTDRWTPQPIRSGRPIQRNPAEHGVLRAESLTDSETRALLVALRLATLAGLIALVILLSAKLKLKDGSFFFHHNTLEICNLVVGGGCLVALAVTLSRFCWHNYLSHRSGKQWSRRQEMQLCICLCELTVQSINVVCYIIPNVYSVWKACAWGSHLINICGIIRWTCWNTLFLLAVVQGHNFNFLKTKVDGLTVHAGQMVMDAGCAYHIRKVPLWVGGQVILICFLVWLVKPDPQPDTCKDVPQNKKGCNVTYMPPGTESDCRAWTYNCKVARPAVAYSIALATVMATYFVVYTYFILASLRQLSKLPYMDYRIENFAVRLQIRMRMTAFGFMIFGMLLLWFVLVDSCTAYLEIWLGMLPLQLTMTVLVICEAYLGTPKGIRDHQQLMESLQRFAMLEADMPEQMGRRSASTAPMFCFETALKLQCWASLIYGYREGLPVTIPTTRPETLQLGMQLFQLEQSELLWERQGDTHVLIAWACNTIVIAFRGTASLSNVYTALHAWRTRHSASVGHAWLGTHAMVHTGFLSSWHSNGLHMRVVQLLREILGGWSASALPCKVYVTASVSFVFF